MADRNSSRVKVFVFMGFTDRPELAATMFALFLMNYCITIVGNLGMLLLIRVDACLHTPMYFFLSNLSFLDICYSTTISPRLLVDLLRERKVITYPECLVQFYFYVTFATTECYLLAAMAYDRYMAICNPLTYTITMSQKVCAFLVAGSYIAGSVNAMIHTGCLTHLSFCGPNVIDHFFCEGPPVFELSCSDTSINLYAMFAFVGFNLVVTHLTVLISYSYIVLRKVLRGTYQERGKKMANRSSSRGKLFVLLGFNDHPELAAILFALFALNPIVLTTFRG
uniref:olfactory receptor 5AU1-like n=1 Tax=Podarcis muralis TaxID=64176 RepID=UPI0010A053C0|nr:olfactory receptor 5AU1-like [Podarcis muralis]